MMSSWMVVEEEVFEVAIKQLGECYVVAVVEWRGVWDGGWEDEKKSGWVREMRTQKCCRTGFRGTRPGWER